MQQEKKVKQVVVMRMKYETVDGKPLNLRKGKIAAQAAHASMKVLLDMGEIHVLRGVDPSRRFTLDLNKPLYQWLSGGFTKVVCQVDTEAELVDLYKKATALEIPCSMIVDSGATEFGGVATTTCIAIGPDYEDKVDVVTGHLRLL